MGRKAKIPVELKIKAVEKYLDCKGSKSAIAAEYGVSETALSKWIMIYKSQGINGFGHTKNTHYSSELKMMAVQDYLNGKGSLSDICIKYKILSDFQLRSWIKVYNGHKEFKGHNSSGGNLMTKGRKTTYEERLKIVTDCMGSNYDYNGIAEKYKVSYQQVYTWVRKFNENGADGLIDKRGKVKSEDQLTELDRLKAENKRLEAEKRRLQIELDLIKKLEELKVRRGYRE